MKKIKVFIVYFICFLCGFLSVFAYYATKKENVKTATFNFPTRQRILLAIDAFKNIVREDGSIIYQIDLTNTYLYTDNNIVREMGSAYSLAYAYWLLNDDSLRPILKNIINHFYIISIRNDNSAFIVNEQKQINSGATAFALLTILYYEQRSEDSSYQYLRENFKNALLSLYHQHEGIWTAPDNPEISPYYEGETWLALAVYEHFYPNDKEIQKILSELSELMMNKYGDYFDASFFHWGVQAAAILTQNHKEDTLYKFIKRQLELYINNVDIGTSAAFCAQAEALAQAAMALKNVDNEMQMKTVVRLNKQLDVTHKLQDALLAAYSEHKIPSGMNKYLGLFLATPDNLVIRNDNTQHCMIAMLKSLRLFSRDN